MKNKKQLSEFLSFFDEPLTLAYFQKDGSILPSMGTVITTKEKFLDEYDLLVSQNITAHLLLNKADGKGRKKENILHPQVFFCDLDREIDTEELTSLCALYKPHIVVRSSPKKFHFYWRCPKTLSLSRWTIIQKGINKLFASPEPNAGAITHLLRLPLMPRITKTGQSFTPDIIHINTEAKEVSYRQTFKGIYQASKEAAHKEKQERLHLTSAIDGKALDDIHLTEIPKNNRNNTLFSLAISVVSKGIALDKPTLTAFMTRINKEIPQEAGGAINNDELSSIINSAFPRGIANYSLSQKNKNIEAEQRKVLLTSDIEDTQTQEEYPYDFSAEAIDEPFGSTAIIDRILSRFGKFFLRTETSVMVFSNTSNVWVKQTLKDFSEAKYYFDIVLKEMVFSTKFCMQYTNSKGQTDYKKISKERERYLNIKTIKAYIEALFNDYRLAFKRDTDFDANPDLFFCSNGVLNLRTGELRPVCSTDYLLKKSPVIFDPTIDTTAWESFVYDIFSENIDIADSVAFLQELFGYSISGNMTAQYVYCHFGIAANGKSTLLKALKRLAGDYCIKVSPDALSAKAEQKFERVAAQLIGIRCCIIDDIETKYAFNEAFIKTLTDTEISCRKLYAEHQVIRNTAKFHMGLNCLPEPDKQSEGFFRRIKITHYNRTFEPDPEKGREIDEFLTSQLSAILLWALQGYQRFLDRKSFRDVAEFKILEEEYKEESGTITKQDLLTLFELEEDENMHILCKDAIEIFEKFKRDRGDDCLISKTSFGLWVKKVFGITSRLKRNGDGVCKTYSLRVKQANLIKKSENILEQSLI